MLNACAIIIDHIHAVPPRIRNVIGTLLKLTDERVVDATVEGTGVATTRAGSLLAYAHRAALPRAAAAVFTGALLLGVVAAIYGAAS